jgi:hypothetical protein
VPAVSLSPEQADAHLGWFAMFATVDLRASSTWTRAQLGWRTNGPGLLADLQMIDYSSLIATR